jgi:oligoribonuclease (3'-5' exoribonuclease)
MPRDDVILWVDLETTGNHSEDEIVEIGLALTDSELNVIDTFSRVVKPSAWGFNRIESNEVVKAMHEASGLMDDLISATTAPNPFVMADIDLKIRSWLDNAAGKSKEHIPFAGSGVVHFDRKYIQRFLPRLNSRITFWAYDVGVMRRTWQLLGLQTPVETKAHRALDDVYAAIDEYAFYCEQLKKLKEV